MDVLRVMWGNPACGRQAGFEVSWTRKGGSSMNANDCPPGHRFVRFGGDDNQPWLGEPGDIILQRGPRIGQRLWLVVHTEIHKVWTHVVLRQVDTPTFTQAAMDGGHEWYWGPKP